MRIVIDARMRDESGIGRYIRNLIFYLSKIDHKNNYTLLLKKKIEIKLPGNFNYKIINIPWYSLKEQIMLPGILSSLNPDLVHFPHFNVPIFYKGKFIVTIHDLIHQHFQTRTSTTHNPFFHTVKKIGYKKVFNKAILKSIKIITPSEFVKNQIIKEWNISPSKIIVTHEGVDEDIIELREKVTSKDFINLKNKFKFSKPFFFYIGNAQPHKNIKLLINAFEEIQKNFTETFLVLSGPGHYFWQKIKKETKSKNIIFTGFVSDKDMVILYKNSLAFVMPSLEEGFGLPVIEAMVCNTPVIASDIGTLNEIAGSAAIYFNPNNASDLMKALEKLLTDKNIRQKLINAGNSQSQKYSWENMARQTLSIYQKYN